MVDITPLISEGAQIVQSYSAGRFRISGKVHEGAVIVFPDHTELWQVSNTIPQMGMDDFQRILDGAGQLDVILLGTGKAGEFLPPELRKALRAKGLNIDVMDTGAACRTYNVLMTEGRRVAAMLLPV